MQRSSPTAKFSTLPQITYVHVPQNCTAQPIFPQHHLSVNFVTVAHPVLLSTTTNACNLFRKVSPDATSCRMCRTFSRSQAQ
eukprot:m.889937 g.889937  ORF g.889937 m.889937 type:complete len:82 (-) comp23647_c0_seq15:534-779(-)